MTNEHYHYGLGRRKSAVARVRLYPGNGNVIINGKPIEVVIPRASSRQEMLRPLAVTEHLNAFNVQGKVAGGGIEGWAGAIRHGIARALVVADESNRHPLRAVGPLPRGPRGREREDPGPEAG